MDDTGPSLHYILNGRSLCMMCTAPSLRPQNRMTVVPVINIPCIMRRWQQEYQAKVIEDKN